MLRGMSIVQAKDNGRGEQSGRIYLLIDEFQGWIGTRSPYPTQSRTSLAGLESQNLDT